MSPATPSGGRSCGSGPEENLEWPSRHSPIRKGSSVLITMNVSPVNHRTDLAEPPSYPIGSVRLSRTISPAWWRQNGRGGSTSSSREFIGNITGIPPRAAARHRGIHLAVSTRHEEPAQTTIRDHITSTINQEGTSWHSKSTCS
jgi:hypothetical protein